MTDHDEQELIKTLKQFEGRIIEKMEAITALQFVVQCLCSSLPSEKADTLLKQLRAAREILAETGELVDKGIAERLTSFETVLTGMTTPTLLH